MTSWILVGVAQVISFFFVHSFFYVLLHGVSVKVGANGSNL